MKKWRIIALAITLVIVATVLVLWLVPVMSVTHTKTEPYTATETYSEKEPYTTTETYYDTEPIVKNQNIQYRVVSSSQDDFGWWGISLSGSGADMYVNIQNLDSSNGGTFNVTYHVTLAGGAAATRYGSLYIGAGQTGLVSGQYAGADVSKFTYTVTPPTKQVTEYQQVAKTRDVTQFRDVQKTRDVVKIRDVKTSEKVSVFKYLFD